jgi:hypothetical protein
MIESDLAFAPCNKHFYCSVSLDKRLLFHDITAKANPGILQHFESSHPLVCVTINDEHTVAVGNSKGKLLLPRDNLHL